MRLEFTRTALLLGEEKVNDLSDKKVCIFGVGGVGGFVCEGLARAGIGHFDLFDHDTVDITNINRQIIALNSTVGELKVDVMKRRILDINPDAIVNVHPIFYLPENKDQFDLSQYDYIIDAVDTVTAKLTIISEAKRVKTPIMSSMGAGNKLDPTKLQIADISKTSVDPLARTMRYECKKRRLGKLKVVFSTEVPLKPKYPEDVLKKMNENREKVSPGSISFVPSVAGLMIASEVVKDLLK